MKLFLYKKIYDSVEILTKKLNASLSIKEDYFEISKGKKSVNIYLENCVSSKINSIVFIEDGEIENKFINFTILDEVLNSNNKTILKMFELWLFDSNFNEYLNVLDEKQRITKEQTKEENKTVKRNSEIDESNILQILNRTYKHEFIHNSKNKCFESINKENSCITLISKNYNKTSYNYWYSYRQYQKKIFTNYIKGYLILTFSDSSDVLSLPSFFVNERLNKLGFTGDGEKMYWHLHIKRDGSKYYLRIPNVGLEDISMYLINKDDNDSIDDDLVIEIKSTRSITKKRKN